MKTIRVKVKTGSSRCAVIPLISQGLQKIDFEVLVTKMPKNNEANQQLIEVLSQYLKLRPSKLLLLKGETTHIKILGILE